MLPEEIIALDKETIRNLILNVAQARDASGLADIAHSLDLAFDFLPERSVEFMDLLVDVFSEGVIFNCSRAEQMISAIAINAKYLTALHKDIVLKSIESFSPKYERYEVRIFSADLIAREFSRTEANRLFDILSKRNDSNSLEIASFGNSVLKMISRR